METEFRHLTYSRGGVCSENLRGRDAEVEPTRMYLRRFSEQTPPPPINDLGIWMIGFC